jgi:tripartite-type tricarboxylate transporter receptor subunit TctC
MSRIASALDYPTQPVRIIVGYPPGKASDIIARLMAQSLSERLGQPFVVENRSGGAGNTATEFVKTLAEFIAYAKANPAKINMASAGIGTGGHVIGELFKMTAGVEMLHVPYRGSFLADLLSGQVQVVFGPTSQLLEFIRTNKLRALAVTSSTRLPALPDVPAVGEVLPGFEASLWYGFGAPKDTPTAIIDKLNQTINATLADPKIKARLAELGDTVLTGSPTNFAELITADIEKWAKVIKAANIKPE